MTHKAAFLDFATLGPGIDTRPLDVLVETAYHPHTDPADMPQRLRGRTIAILNKARMDAATIERCSELALIVLAATGTDNVDVAAARAKGIVVANIRDYCTASVVQHVFALILALTQHLARYDTLLRQGGWQRSESFALLDYPVRELRGRTLGVIGHGTLGSAVGRAAECFGMKRLIAVRPGTEGPHPPGRVPVDTLLAEADVVSLHCPLTAATRHLIDAKRLALMKPDALLINTARGGLVDSDALLAALREGRIGGAGIDVLAQEPPPPDEPLLAADLPNLIVTPHIAWAAQEARQRAIEQVAENVREFLAGGPVQRAV